MILSFSNTDFRSIDRGTPTFCLDFAAMMLSSEEEEEQGVKKNPLFLPRLILTENLSPFLDLLSGRNFNARGIFVS